MTTLPNPACHPAAAEDRGVARLAMETANTTIADANILLEFHVEFIEGSSCGRHWPITPVAYETVAYETGRDSETGSPNSRASSRRRAGTDQRSQHRGAQFHEASQHNRRSGCSGRRSGNTTTTDFSVRHDTAQRDIIHCFSRKIQFEEFFQDLVVGQRGVPAVGGEDGSVEFLVGQVEPGGAFVVEVRVQFLSFLADSSLFKQSRTQ